MDVPQHVVGRTLLAQPSGRLDAHGAAVLERALAEQFGGAADSLVLNLAAVTYLSSAAVRVFLQLHRQAARQGGQFALAGLQPYCREVIRISGLEDALAVYPTGAEALAAVEPGHDEWVERLGTFRFSPGSDDPGYLDVLGHIDDVLHARVTAESLRAKAFSAKGYSLGLGGLGPTDEEVLPLLGEMMTIGGTMVWLPTDGSDTPDFLAPRADSDLVKIRTGFNVSLSGEFNEFVHFRASSEAGATMTELYETLFDLSRKRRADFRGVLGLAMRADVAAAFGSGVKRAPIATLAPDNGASIIAPENFDAWFEYDEEPRHRNVTGLITGMGVDLRGDLGDFDRENFAATVYRNPANHADAAVALHNHAVFFRSLAFPDPPRDLVGEIRAVVEEGEFVDMRHLLDRTTITRAWIGLLYVQDFRRDPGD